jgi:phospholipid-binding lipoprotein MlaA
MTRRSPRSLPRLAIVAVALVALGGCASQPRSADEAAYDPLESVNRPIFAFNNALDKAIIRPLAKGYDTVAPGPVKTGVANFFDNLNTPIWALNHLLQGEFTEAAKQSGRFVMNTTLGLLGFIDAASDAGLEKKNANFNQTFGKWGFGPGPYLMLPLLGPSSARGLVATVARFQTDVTWNYFDASVRDKLIVMQIIDTRRRLLPLDRARAEAPDEYIFVREAYSDNVRFEIIGRPNRDDDDISLDFEDEFDDWDEEEREEEGLPEDQ